MSEFPVDWSVPCFSVDVIKQKSTRYCLVIPVINEGGRIRDELRLIWKTGAAENLDVVIADGGSTDGALEGSFLESVGVSALLTKKDTGRLSAQLRMAYAWALQQGYEGIVTIDGNGKDSVESIPLFVRALNEGIDYAQASRFIRGGQNYNAPRIRVLAIRLLHAPLTSLAAREWFTDTTQGFRAYSRRYLLDERVKPFRSCFQDYEILAYLAIRATQLGYKAVEIPTTRTYPINGAIPTKINTLRGYANLFNTLLAACLGKFNP
jgi:hypothetical protein